VTVIDRLVRGEYTDSASGNVLSVPTRSVIIRDSLRGDEGDLVRSLDFGSTLAVVSDAATYDVMGKRVETALQSFCKIIPLRLDRPPYPDTDTVDQLRNAGANADAWIAIGSGTINDLCKYASAQENKPYAVFGTAPSMNGFTSVNAAMSVNGLKRSLAAAAPAGVFLDLEVLAGAPKRMICAGLGDSLCRPTAQTDWLIAHYLLDQPYSDVPFNLLAEDEEGLFAESDALMRGDLVAMGRLARTLVLSGFGMTLSGGSYPASQGEHLISHYIEMMAKNQQMIFHGEQIAVTTLTMARLHERLLGKVPPKPKSTNISKDDVTHHFGPDLGSLCWPEISAKSFNPEQAEQLSSRIVDCWDIMCDRIDKARIPSEKLHRILQKAKAPLAPLDLGWSPDFYNTAVKHARLIRKRYTALDLAADSGVDLL
tara:strand:+ start:2346 stop:3623 length:1278 start_codon:yes stop_codon:yes gene_type:complete